MRMVSNFIFGNVYLYIGVYLYIKIMFVDCLVMIIYLSGKLCCLSILLEN